MTKADLIEALKGVPDHAPIYVWESYNAGCMTTDIVIDIDAEGSILFEGAA